MNHCLLNFTKNMKYMKEELGNINIKISNRIKNKIKNFNIEMNKLVKLNKTITNFTKSVKHNKIIKDFTKLVEYNKTITDFLSLLDHNIKASIHNKKYHFSNSEKMEKIDFIEKKIRETNLDGKLIREFKEKINEIKKEINYMLYKIIPTKEKINEVRYIISHTVRVGIFVGEEGNILNTLNYIEEVLDIIIEERKKL